MSVYTHETMIKIKSLKVFIILKCFCILFVILISHPSLLLPSTSDNHWSLLCHYSLIFCFYNFILSCIVSLFAWYLSFCIIILRYTHIVCVLIVYSFDFWGLAHCIDISKFVCPFTCSWTFKLFAGFGYIHKATLKVVYTTLHFHFYWVNI